MEHDYNKALTKEDLYEIVFDEVCNKFGYDRDKANHLLKNNDQFRQRVGDCLSPFLIGRPTPIKKPRLGEEEGQRCFNVSLFWGAYPRKVQTDDGRLKHLQNLYRANELSKDEYFEFASVLNVQLTDVNRIFEPDVEVVFE